MSRTSGAAVTVALWAAFLAACGAACVLLLHACRLSLLAVGLAGAWNFCPAGPPGLSAEAGRAGELQRIVARLEADLAGKHLACAAIPKPPPPPFELPREAGPPRVQQTAALKPPPPPPPPPKPKADLPADRWNKGDLSILEGCWQLGRESRGTRVSPRGTEMCVVKAGRICFGKDGAGSRETSMQCPGGDNIFCQTAIAANFPGDTQLHTSQPTVPCNVPLTVWNGPENALSCTRVSDTLAMCRDALGFEHEFRR